MSLFVSFPSLDFHVSSSSALALQLLLISFFFSLLVVKFVLPLSAVSSVVFGIRCVSFGIGFGLKLALSLD